MIYCVIPITFSLEQKNDYLCFTKESLKNVDDTIENAPIINPETGNVIGVLNNVIDVIETDKCVTYMVSASLWMEGTSEVYIKKQQDNVVKSFSFGGVYLKTSFNK